MIQNAQIWQIVLVLGLTLLGTLLFLNAQREAKALRQSALAEAHEVRDEARKLMEDAQRREERIALREREIAEDHRTTTTYAREVEQRVAVVARDEKRLAADRDKLRLEHQEALAAVAKMKVPAAKEQLMTQLIEDAESAVQAQLHRLDNRLREEAQGRARDAIAEAMQRVAADEVGRRSVTLVPLPSEEMKGRIIGREGRNIKAFEAVTGVNLIMEDGSDSIMLSSFDVERRESAEVALAALMEDGRIHPSRIEAAYREAVAKAPDRHVAAGLDAADGAGVAGLRPQVIETLGRLRLRTSYGQNVLSHMVECANLAAGLAVEIGADESLARRAAFLHDIGKALTADRKGTHAALGAAFLREAGESDAVVNAVAAHHDEVPAESLEAALVQVADTISAARPGARREDVEDYATRLAELEASIAKLPGVEEVHALSAGREVRVIVSPKKVSDSEVKRLARTIAQRIVEDPNHPGEVKVTVIRETRADAVAG